jgi:phosphate uptake regulator
MRRKIVKQGAATLTMSLPTKWAQKFGLKAGDEVEVNEGDKGLVLSPVGTHLELKGEIDITGLSKSMVWRYMNTFYVNGFDEIYITGCSEEQVALLKEVPSGLVGFSFIEHKGSTCVLKCISETRPDQFDGMLKKMFFILSATAKEITEAIKINNSEFLKGSKIRDRDLNNATLFCLRILSKYGYKNQKKTTAMQLFIFFLENIGDIYVEIANIRLSAKAKKIPLKDIKILEKVNDTVYSFNKVFYEQNKEDLKNLYEQNKLLKREIDDMVEKGNSDALLYTVRRIPELIGSLVESLMMIYL